VGTVLLDGIIEGPVPPAAEGAERLHEWVKFSRDQGVPFDLRIDGPAFSLLAGGEPLRAGKTEIFQDTVRQVIDQLLEVFPEELRTHVLSTVRSTEYQDGVKVESVYAVTAKGVRVHERKVPWEASKAARPLSWRPLVPYLVAAAVVVSAVVVLAFLLDFGALWRGFTTKYTALDPDRVELEAASLARYVTCKKLGVDKTKTQLAVEVERTPAFPLDLAAYRAEEERILAEGNLQDLVILRKLVVDGYVRLEFTGADGTVLASEERSVRALLTSPTTVVHVPVRTVSGAVKVRIGY
jgi:hypothetical protein